MNNTYPIDGWWSQGVTVGYERITGRRLPFQRDDGTFTAGRSRTIAVDAVALRAMLLSEADREDRFPGSKVTLRSKPTSNALRLGIDNGIDSGVVLIEITPQASGNVKVSVAHAKLASLDEVDAWKHYWGEWLEG